VGGEVKKVEICQIADTRSVWQVVTKACPNVASSTDGSLQDGEYYTPRLTSADVTSTPTGLVETNPFASLSSGSSISNSSDAYFIIKPWESFTVPKVGDLVLAMTATGGDNDNFKCQANPPVSTFYLGVATDDRQYEVSPEGCTACPAGTPAGTRCVPCPDGTASDTACVNSSADVGDGPILSDRQATIFQINAGIYLLPGADRLTGWTAEAAQAGSHCALRHPNAPWRCSYNPLSWR